MATCISNSPEETLALGEAWGREAEPGWVIGLSGELGTGKTQLIKGLARGLGIRAPVLSPTFVLVHEYPGGRLPLFHLDLYRLGGPEEIIAAGLEEYLSRRDGVVAIEWVERWAGPDGRLPAPGLFRRVWLEELDPTRRRIGYEDSCA